MQKKNLVLAMGDKAFGRKKGSKIGKIINFCENLPQKNKI
jgi:hypothetical protein